MSISRTFSKIFSVKEWCDLETRGRCRSRPLEMAPFDRPYTTFCWSAIVYQLYPVPFLSYLTLKNIVTLKYGLKSLKVIQNGTIRKLIVRFPIRLP